MSPQAETPLGGVLDSPGRLGPSGSTADDDELFRAGFELSAVGMAHLSVAGTFIRVNARLCEMTGYERSELVGMDFRKIVLAGEFGAADEARLGRMSVEGGSYSAERRYLRKNGEILWFSIAATFLPGPGGAAQYGTSVIEDITERKSAEARLQRLNLLHGVVSEVSQRAGRAPDEPALFALVTEVAVERGGLRRALVLETRSDTTALHIVAVHRGDPAGSQAGTEAAIAAADPLAQAVRRGQRAVFAAAGDEALSLRWLATDGTGAIACFPLRLGGDATGALVVVATEADYFREDELALLTAVAHAVGLTVDSIRAARQLG